MPPVRYQLGSFPPGNLDWPQLVPLLGPASAAIARYDGALAAVPNPMVLLSPLTTQEAVLSSKIEGTQATMGEVLEFEAGGPGLCGVAQCGRGAASYLRLIFGLHLFCGSKKG